MAIGRIVLAVACSVIRPDYCQMERLDSWLWPKIDTIITVPATKFSDDTAWSSGKANIDDIQVNGDARSPLHNGIDDRLPPASPFPVTKFACVVSSIVRNDSLPRLAARLGPITRRATFDAQRRDMQLVAQPSPDALQPRRPIVGR